MTSTTVQFHGFMKKKYGKEITVPGTSIKQIINALRFRFGQQIITDIEKNNWVLVTGNDLKSGRNLSEDDLQYKIFEGSLNLIPATIGAAKRFAQIIIGIILIIYSFYGGGPQAFQLGMTMLIGGVINLVFAPKPPKGINSEEQEGNYIYNGAVNVTTQGGPVPLLFGEVHRTASVVISSDFSTDEVGQLVDSGVGDQDEDTTDTFIDVS